MQATPPYLFTGLPQKKNLFTGLIINLEIYQEITLN
jgi:hypothetical protein